MATAQAFERSPRDRGHWEGIAAYCQPENKVALGFVEGLNNKIRVIQRRVYGLRDEGTCGSRSSPPCCRPSSVAEFDEIDPHESPKTPNSLVSGSAFAGNPRSVRRPHSAGARAASACMLLLGLALGLRHAFGPRPNPAAVAAAGGARAVRRAGGRGLL